LNGVDAITQFTTTSDKLNIDALTSETATTAVTGALTATAGKVYFLASATAGDADSAAAVAAMLSAGATWTNGTTGAVAYFVVNDNNSGSLWAYTEAGGTEIETTELTLIATIDAKIVAADLLFA
jgi:hypothetical protein